MIKPHSSIKYPVLILFYNNFNLYSHDTNSIKLEYTNERRERMPGILFNPEEDNKNVKYYFDMALRGDYISSNSLIYNNKKINKINYNK